VFSPVRPGPGFAGFMATHIHWYVTVAYLVWFTAGMLYYLVRRKNLEAFRLFAIMWRRYVWPSSPPAVK